MRQRSILGRKAAITVHGSSVDYQMHLADRSTKKFGFCIYFRRKNPFGVFRANSLNSAQSVCPLGPQVNSLLFKVSDEYPIDAKEEEES